MSSHVESTIDQHIEGALSEAGLRVSGAQDWHFSLRDLIELDSKIDSHCAMLAAAGADCGNRDVCSQEEPPAAFVDTLIALSSTADHLHLAVPEGHEQRRFFEMALSWVDYDRVAELLSTYLASDDPARIVTGLTIHRNHRVPPQSDVQRHLASGSAEIQTETIRLIAQVPIVELIGDVGACDTRSHLRSEAGRWQALLLRADDRFTNEAVTGLRNTISNPALADYSGATYLIAFLSIAAARELIRDLAAGSQAELRISCQCAGILGIPDGIPWLIEMMAQPQYARVAGEAFYRITGLRLDQRPYEGDWPDGFEAGPNDDPDDDNVEMDEDENLPWPIQHEVAAWWEQNRSRFKSNTRYLLGFELDNEAWLRKVLVLGRQRERATAALELAIRNPTEPLFNVEEHGRRQMKKLGIKRLPSEEYRCNHIEAGPDDTTWMKYLRDSSPFKT